MQRSIPLMATLLVTSFVLALAACSGASAGGGTYIISNSGGITASSGTLSNSGGAWSFDAGYVPQYTTENVTFTVTNSGSEDFSAQGAQTFTPTTDFSDSLSGTFIVKAHSSNSFTGSFTPTDTPIVQETGTLTLTPTGGSPIVISLKGTSDLSFQLFDAYPPAPAQIVVGTPGWVYWGSNSTLTIYNQSATATITLTGSPYVSISGTDYSMVTQPPSNTIAVGGNETFTISNSSSSGGNIGTISINGVVVEGATTTPFNFTCTVADHGW